MSINDPSSGLPKLALIAGPTASGKSARALEWAMRAGGTIINADASQVYRDLRILSARPSPEEEARVPHLLYGYRDATAPCSAAEWATHAEAAIAAVLAERRLPILVGGTGLYLRTLLDGIAPVPAIEPEVRALVRALSSSDARAALEQEDRDAARELHPNDRGRIARALEVVRSTGRPISAWRAERIGGIRHRVTLDVVLVDPPAAELYARCDARVPRMVADGALEEVAALLDRDCDPALPIMRAIGVPQLAAHLRGQTSLDDAIEAICLATRHYAKRQRTWFRNQPLAGTRATG